LTQSLGIEIYEKKESKSVSIKNYKSASKPNLGIVEHNALAQKTDIYLRVKNS